MSLSKWMDVNRGLGPSGSHLLPQLLESVYKTVSHQRIPELVIRRSGRPESRISLQKPVLDRSAQLFGWFLTKCFGSTNVLYQAPTTDSCIEVADLFSETLSGTQKISPPSVLNTGAPKDSLAGMMRVCMSLCHSILFFSSSGAACDVPFAFIHLPQVRVETARRREGAVLSFLAKPEEELEKQLQSEVAIDPAGRFEAEAAAAQQQPPLEPQAAPARKLQSPRGRSPPRRSPKKQSALVTVVFLLTDGRWQDFKLPRLDIRIDDEEGLKTFLPIIEAVCSDTTVII